MVVVSGLDGAIQVLREGRRAAEGRRTILSFFLAVRGAFCCGPLSEVVQRADGQSGLRFGDMAGISDVRLGLVLAEALPVLRESRERRGVDNRCEGQRDMGN